MATVEVVEGSYEQTYRISDSYTTKLFVDLARSRGCFRTGTGGSTRGRSACAHRCRSMKRCGRASSLSVGSWRVGCTSSLARLSKRRYRHRRTVRLQRAQHRWAVQVDFNHQSATQAVRALGDRSAGTLTEIEHDPIAPEGVATHCLFDMASRRTTK